VSSYSEALALLSDMGFPITQLSEAKFVSGVRAFNLIGIKRNCLCTSAEGLQNPFAKKTI
jgi:hypothetical protein